MQLTRPLACHTQRIRVWPRPSPQRRGLTHQVEHSRVGGGVGQFFSGWQLRRALARVAVRGGERTVGVSA